MVSQRLGPRLLLLGVSVNLLVILVCYALLGWNLSGAGSAARNTARFASLFFVIGFAVPGLRRWVPGMVEADWLRAFMAAQMVHFASVAVLHLEFLKDFGKAPLLQVMSFVLLGFLLVLTVGVLAEPRAGAVGIVRLVAIHLVFLIFALDYLKHPIHPLRVMGFLYLFALVLRYVPVKQQAATAAG